MPSSPWGGVLLQWAGYSGFNVFVESNSTAPPWRPDRFARRRPYLEARAAILTAVRGWFADQGFIEVDTPALQVSPGLEPHLRAFATELAEPFDEATRRLFLHTSPEYAMKKLLAAGVPRLFQIAHVWRNEARSPIHHPEFTMLEWYAADAPWTDLIDRTEALVRVALDAVPSDLSHGLMRWGDGRADVAGSFERLTVAEAFTRYAGVDVLATIADDGAVDDLALAAAARAASIPGHGDDTWEDTFFRIFVDRVEPRLGFGRPTFLEAWPAPLAALAQLDPSSPRIAQRVELYVAGLELANGFGELTDAAIQRRRFEADVAAKARLGAPAYPIDEDLLAALDHGIPPTAGMALGFDRLVMLATGASAIDDVLWLPVAGG